MSPFRSRLSPNFPVTVDDVEDEIERRMEDPGDDRSCDYADVLDDLVGAWADEQNDMRDD